MNDTTQHDPRDEELARLREQVVAQQARIAELRDVLVETGKQNIEFCCDSTYVVKLRADALATTDDTAALKQRDDKVWNEAVDACIQVCTGFAIQQDTAFRMGFTPTDGHLADLCVTDLKEQKR